MANQQNEIPASLEPVASLQLGDKELKVFATAVWYKFFTSLSSLLQNLTGGVLAFTTETDTTAAGLTQGTAYVLTTEWVEVTTTPIGSGVRLAAFGPGVPNVVFNAGINTLRVYPPVGSQIDALGVNSPYLLAATKTQTFNQIGNARFRSTQLG